MFALETAGGIVHAAVLDGGDFRVASSPVGSDGWSVAPVRVPVGAGPVPTVQLVLSGAAGWLVENDRTVVGGARLANGSWVAWTPPCADVVGPAYLAASSPTELAAACDVGLWSNPTGDHLYLSHDGGSTFAPAGTAAPLTMAAMAAMASPSVVVVGGSDATGSVLAATTDAGRTWKRRHATPGRSDRGSRFHHRHAGRRDRRWSGWVGEPADDAGRGTDLARGGRRRRLITPRPRAGTDAGARRALSSR